MTNAETNAAATVAERGAQGAPRGRKTAKGGKAAAPKKAAPAAKKAARTKEATAPRTESKGAKVLEPIARAKGATLTELMKATEWQAHSIRGFISTASKKYKVTIESSKNDKGERILPLQVAATKFRPEPPPVSNDPAAVLCWYESIQECPAWPTSPTVANTVSRCPSTWDELES